MAFDAGSIDARLTLDRSAFTRELQEARAQAERFENNEIRIRASLTDLTDEFLRLQEDINNLDGRDIDLNVNVQDTEALDRLKAQIDSLTGKTVDIGVNTDLIELTLFEERVEALRDRVVRLGVEIYGTNSLTALQARVDSLTGRNVTIGVDTDASEIVALQAAIAALNDETITINVRFTNSRAEFTRMLNQIQEISDTPIVIGTRFENSRAEFTRIRNQINDLSGTAIDINVEVDESQLAALASEIEAVSGTSVSVDVDTGDAQPELAALAAEIETLSGKHVNLEIDFDSGEALAQLSLFHAEAETLMRPVVLGVDLNQDHLAAIHEDLNRAAARKYTINVDADTTAAMAELAALEATTDALLGRDHQISLDFDIDQASAIGQLALFDAAVEGMTSAVNVQVDVDGVPAALAQLEVLDAAIKRVDGQDIEVDAKTGSGFRGTAGTVTRMEALIAGILLLAPLVPAVVAPAAAAIGGLAAGLTAAAGGAAVLGLGIAPAAIEFGKAQVEIGKAKDKLAELTPGTKEYAKQAQVVADLQSNFNTQFGGAATAFGEMKDAWASFQDATRPAAIGLMTQFFGIARDILPNLTPIFNAFGVVAAGALQSIGDFINGPEGERMFTFFEEIGAQSFDEILQSIGNLTLFFGRLFEAFGPFAVEMLDGLSEITAGWAEWADGIGETQGFQDFLEYARTVGPQVLDMLGSLFDAFIALGEALAPLAGPTLTAFTAIFDAIASAPTGLLTTLIVLFGGLYLAVQGFTALGQAYRATVAAMGVATSIFNGIMTVASAVMGVVRTAMMLLNLAFAANPIGVIVLAILALIAVFVLAYNKIGWFRDGVNAVVDAVVGAFQWLYDQLWGHSILKDLINAFTTAFKIIKDVVLAPVRLTIAIVKTVFNALVGYFKGVFETYKSIIRTAWETIKTIWRNALGVIKDALHLIFNAFPQFVRDKIGAVMDAIRGMKERIQGFFSGAADWLKTAGWNIIKGLVTGIRDAAGDILQGTLDWVTDKIPDWKGPADRDRRLLQPVGTMIMGGLVTGIDSGVPALEGSLGRITNKIAATSAGISATLDARGRMGPGQAAAARGGDTINIISPSRLRVDEGYGAALQRKAVAAGIVS